MNNSFPFTKIESLDEFIKRVNDDAESWDFKDDIYGAPWFRGQPNASKPPLPSLYRNPSIQGNVNEIEFALTRAFRERADTLGSAPGRKEVDKWLFLMQHHGLPTRLLDWTEGALIALYFAVSSKDEFLSEESEKCELMEADRAVWMIHPTKLNYQSIKHNGFPNTWVMHDNFATNFHDAFGAGEADVRTLKRESVLPIAVPTSYCHGRMFAQKSCFTIHGKDHRDFETLFIDSELVEQGYLKKYLIPKDCALEILRTLKLMGITNSYLFPDLDGLALELKDRFCCSK